MKVDFHVHSTASDGTFAPSELVEQAERGAFAAFALTDHDNCDGVAEFLAAEASVPRIAGVELSMTVEEAQQYVDDYYAAIWESVEEALTESMTE